MSYFHGVMLLFIMRHMRMLRCTIFSQYEKLIFVL